VAFPQLTRHTWRRRGFRHLNLEIGRRATGGID
jgi:hypothetical protein